MAAQEVKFVDSSHIGGIAYDDETNDLVVTYRGGATYVYKNVPPSVVSGFADAPSAGSYLQRAIKGQYEFKKVG